MISFFLIALSCACAQAHLGFVSNKLQPVQGLYIKPSTDGITGDLYVAATENSGVNSQWVADAPVNFMSGYKTQTAAAPVAYSSSLTTATSPHEQVVTAQKQTVITSPPVQYSYGVPATTEDAKAVYPYMTSSVPAAEGLTSQYHAGYPMAYSPYQYMYPYLMQAAAASAANALKDLGLCEELANSVTSQSTSAWPSASYAYPWQYMMDPKMWAQQAAATVAPSTPEPITAVNSENASALTE